MGGAHGRLEVQSADVLPVLLKQRHQEVDGHLDVHEQLLLGHGDVADGNTHAQHLLQLELDGGLDVLHLVSQGVAVGHQGRELTGLVKTGAQQTGNLLDDSLGGKEGVVLLGCRGKHDKCYMGQAGLSLLPSFL